MQHDNDTHLTDITPEIQQRIEAANQYAKEVIEIRITDDEGLKSAGTDLIQIKTYLKTLEAARKDITGPMDKRKKAIMAYFKGPKDYLETAEGKLKEAIGEYQEQIAEAARQAAEKEAKRIEQLAERRAQRAEGNGDLTSAEITRAEAAEEAALTIATANIGTGKVEGIGSRKTYHAVVVDKLALLAAVVAGQVPERFIDINMVELNKLARALKTDLCYPGVVVQEETSVTARSAQA